MSKPNLGDALVTGASTGIGRATAKALRDAGYRVFGTSRKAVPERSDGITMLTCDVSQEASVAKLIDEVLSEAGRIDLLVNNAGVGLLGGAEESSTAQAQALFDVNVFGVLRVTNAVLPTMRRQGKGRIINLSSVLGLIPAPYSALYASTKHAIEGYSESLDHEVRPFGIRVVLVEPAYTRTSFEENLSRPDQVLGVYDAARAGMNVDSAQSDRDRRCARSRGRDGPACSDQFRAEAALRRGEDGAPDQSSAPFRTHIGIRQEPAEAERPAGLAGMEEREAVNCAAS